MMWQQYQLGFRNCATCQYWGGDRRVSQSQRYTVETPILPYEMQLGVCRGNNPDKRGKMTHPSSSYTIAGCWERWYMLDD